MPCMILDIGSRDGIVMLSDDWVFTQSSLGTTEFKGGLCEQCGATGGK